MAEKTQKVLVKVRKDHPFPFYRRAGMALAPGDNIVEVTDAQLAQLKSDERLLVGPVPPPEPEQKPESGGKPGDKK